MVPVPNKPYNFCRRKAPWKKKKCVWRRRGESGGGGGGEGEFLLKSSVRLSDF